MNYEEFASKVVTSNCSRNLTFEDLATTTSLRVRRCFDERLLLTATTGRHRHRAKKKKKKGGGSGGGV